MRGDFVLAAAPPGSTEALGRLAAGRQVLERSADWRAVRQDRTADLWVRGVAAGPLPTRGETCGAVLGQMWTKPGADLAAGRREASMAAAGRALLNSTWGSYVAILWDEQGQGLTVLRDPSGAAPAVSWRVDDLSVVASDPEAAPAAWRSPRQGICWDVVQDWLQRPASSAAWSALENLRILAPGDLLDVRSGVATPMWRPAWVDVDTLSAPQDLARRLRATVTEVCGALAADAGSLVLELSGGLDSSLVAAALAAGGATPLAVNFYAADDGGDERSWAQAAAEACGLPLRMLPKRETPFAIRDFEELAGGAAPALDTFDAQRDRQMQRLLADSGARATVTGQGGDAVFFQMGCAGILREAWRAQGWAAVRGGLVRDLAERLDASIWAVLRQSLAGSVGRASARNPFLRDPAPSARPAHPWLEGLESLGPARQLQIGALADMQLKFGPTRRARVAAVRHPLLTQPVVEFGLATPSWLQVAGGTDRAVARAAFADLLPAEIVQRRLKGALNHLYARRLARGLPELRPYLLDGALAQAGLLDRPAIAEALTPDDLFWRGRGLQLLRFFAVEAWVRRACTDSA